MVGGGCVFVLDALRSSIRELHLCNVQRGSETRQLKSWSGHVPLVCWEMAPSFKDSARPPPFVLLIAARQLLEECVVVWFEAGSLH